MPENITLEQLSTAQNNHFAAQTADMNELKENTAAALSALSELANRVYGYSHDAKVAKDLETVYADIIEDNPGLADKSAVGFTTFLKDGDKIETQGNICYINGDLTETDYTFSGENSEGGFEVCVVWYFENDGELNCISREFGLIDVIIKKSITEITSSEEFFAFSNSIETNVALTFAPYSTRKQRNIKGGIYHDKISLALEEYESNVSALTNTPTLITFNGSKALKKVRFPELTSVDGVADLSHQIFADCSNLVIDDESFPKLETIGSSIAPAQWSMFKNVPTLILPESLTSVGSGVSLNNKVVVVKFRDATTVSDNWCSSTPTERFEMVDDWGATINIAVAAANWNKTDFVDLFTDNLRDMDDEVREIKIPSDIYDSLTDEEFALAEDKNWTVGA